MAERIELEQNTQEWLDYRFDHRNASEAGTVMGVNPYQSIAKLRKIKETREDSFKGNAATDYGHKWEDAAKEKAEFLLGVDLEPAIFRDGVYSASLDAYGEEGNESYKVEIKCPYGRQGSRLWKQAQIEGSWDQVIPEYYVWQIVHQHMVMPTARTFFFIFIPNEDFRLIECFVTDEQVAALKEAWEKFANPEAELNTEYLRPVVDRRSELKLQIAQLSDELKTLESELKDSGEVEFPGGLKLVERIRKGSIDQKKMEKFGLTVDNFRKPDLTYKTFVEAS